MRVFSIYAAAMLALSGAPAYATLNNVTPPDVKAGKAVAEIRSGVDFGDDQNARAFRLREQFDYDFNEWFNLRLFATQAQREAGVFEYGATGVESKLQLLEEDETGYGGAIKLAYALADGDDKPDSAAVLWFGRTSPGAYILTHNVVFSHEVGEDKQDGLGLALSWQGLYKLPEGESKLGFEMFNNFGRLNHSGSWEDQRHTIGPVMYGKFSDSWGFQTGLQFGISRQTPDSAFKFFLNRSF